MIPLALVLVFAAGTLPAAPATAAGSDRDLIALACGMPHDELLRTWRGWSPDRGGELQMIANLPNFVGSGLPHVGPWDYVQDVPMLWYGPGYIRAQGAVARPVTSVGIAPTAARLLDFPYHAPDGSPMTEAIIPKDERANQEPPKLIVTLVWDAGGRDVLAAHSKSWPYLKSLIPKGTWYQNASVGSSPTSTAQIHATIGTGAFPDDHLLVGHRLRVGPTIVTPWAQGPNLIVEPTLADLYDRAMGNAPKVGIIATVNIHFGMMSHGSFFNGGDKDIGLTRSVTDPGTLTDEGFKWNLPGQIEPYYTLPSYVNDTPGFAKDVEAVDRADGQLDGKWRTNSIDQLLGGFDTPARIPYQERVLESVVQREGFGADTVPDLLYANFKEIDYISHVWTMNSAEMDDAVRAQDAALAQLVRFLDAQVGKGQWAMVLTADHGATRKALLKLCGRHLIEAVLMGYPDRVTVCVSSQAGCAMGCGFCATGQMGLLGNLTAGEIAGQVLWARREAAALPDTTPQRLTNVVFMGMGEPIGGCLLPSRQGASAVTRPILR